MTDALVPELQVAQLALGQGGVFHRDQAIEVGFSPAAINRRLASKSWVAVHPGVYRATTTPDTRAAAGHAARLWVGEPVAYSHATASRLQGLDPRMISARTWLSVPHPRHPSKRTGISVTRTRHFDGWTETRHGLLVMTAARTIVDLAGHLDPVELRRLLYEGVRTGKVTIEDVAAATDAIGNRDGIANLRRIMAEFDPTFEAETEEQADAALRAAGIVLEPQFEVWGDFGLLARIDLAGEELKLGIEIDGDVAHSSRSASYHDKRRDRALSRRGWTISRFPAVELRRQPKAFVREVAQLVEAARRRLRSA